MKILITSIVLLSLSGCAAVDKVKQVWPRAHDPALASGLITLSVSLDKISCSTKDGIEEAKSTADWLNRYAEFRKDPQVVSTKAILENLDKAKEGNEAACNRWLNLSKTRVKIIKESWSGR